MGTNTASVCPTERTGCTLDRYTVHASMCRFSGRIIKLLRLMGISLGLTVLIAGPLPAADGPNQVGNATVDSRWMPWIGSWRLVSNTINTTDEDMKGEFQMKIGPGDRESAVSMKASMDENVLFEDTIIADGSAHTLKDKDCSGIYSYSWSNSGKRLIFESESSCPDESLRKISGISFIDRSQEWLDIQLMQSGEERIITVRRYAAVIGEEDSPKYDLRTMLIARRTAGASFSENEIIELSKKVVPEVLEAAVLEMHTPFKINSKVLVRLADAEVPPSVIDLMVALSFPHMFSIERDTVSIADKSDSTGSAAGGGSASTTYVHYSVIDPYFPWYWGPYTYSLYWGGWPGWGYYPPYYPYPPYNPYPPGTSPPGGPDQRSSGRLVAGQGYTSVTPSNGSTAQPRGEQAGSMSSRSSSGARTSSSTTTTGGNTGAASSRGYSSGSYSSGSSGTSSSGTSSSGTSSGGTYSSGSSGSSSGGSYSSGSSGSSGSYGGSPSASPSGYSGGGSGGSAQSR